MSACSVFCLHANLAIFTFLHIFLLSFFGFLSNLDKANLSYIIPTWQEIELITSTDLRGKWLPLIPLVCSYY